MKGWPRMAGRAGFGEEAAVDAATLVRRLVAGDATALDPLYRRESGAVYRYALALCANPAWAADAMQDAFVAFAGRPQGWDAQRGSSLGAYLAGMARHSLLARWREIGPLDDGVDEESVEDGGVAGVCRSPEDLLVGSQARQELWQALQALPWAYREAIVLVDLQERPYAEAARIAGLELNTLRTRLHRGRLRLATLLGANPEGPSP